jgi:hypothetical protein
MADLPDQELYLYALVPVEVQETFGAIGLFGAEVQLMPAGRLAAVVSPVPGGTTKVRPERRNLTAHQAVVSRLTGREYPVLPVAFGTISPEPAALRDLLLKHEGDLLEQMEKVGGAVEMEVKAELDVPNVFEYFVNARPDLRSARDAVFAKGAEPTRDEKIALGQLFERILEEERTALGAKLTAQLNGKAAGLKENECRSEKELARLSVLVHRGDQSAFDVAIDALARELKDEYRIVVTGPFPGYSFVDLHLGSA